MAPAMPSESAGSKDTMSFPFFKLPTEIRLLIYESILPSQQRIVLDPESYCYHLPYNQDSFGDTKSMIRINQKMHTETIQFIFRNNTVNMIEPFRSYKYLKKLGNFNRQFITTLGFHVESNLGGLVGPCELMHDCPRLKNIRLTCYHNWAWQKVTAQLINHVALRDPDLSVDLEFYTSLWAPSSISLFSPNWAGFGQAMQFAGASKRSLRKRPFPNMPPSVRNVTVTVSANASAAGELVNLQGLEGNSPWSFEMLKRVDGPPQMCVVGWRKRAGANEENTL